jgi:hypothetical protein
LIRRAEERIPVCPVCGETCSEWVKDFNGDIVGCRECIKFVDAWEEDDE